MKVLKTIIFTVIILASSGVMNIAEAMNSDSKWPRLFSPGKVYFQVSDRTNDIMLIDDPVFIFKIIPHKKHPHDARPQTMQCLYREPFSAARLFFRPLLHAP